VVYKRERERRERRGRKRESKKAFYDPINMKRQSKSEVNAGSKVAYFHPDYYSLLVTEA